jgi:hypothetical protein
MFFYSKGKKPVGPLKKSPKSKKSDTSSAPATTTPALAGGVGMVPGMGMGMNMGGMGAAAGLGATTAAPAEEEKEENVEIIREDMEAKQYDKRKEAEINKWTAIYKSFLLGNYSAYANDPEKPISAQKAMEMMSCLDQQTITELQTFSTPVGGAAGGGMMPGGMMPGAGGMMPGAGGMMPGAEMGGGMPGGAGAMPGAEGQEDYRERLAKQMANWAFYYEQLDYWNKYVEQKILCRQLEDDEKVAYDALTNDEDMKTLLKSLTKKVEELSKEQKETYEKMVGAVKENEVNQANYEEWTRKQEQAVNDFAQRWAALYHNAGLKIDGVTYVVRNTSQKPAPGEKDIIKEGLPANAVLLEVPSKHTITPYDLINADGTVKKPTAAPEATAKK